ncbi:Putative spore and germination protein [Bacillus subtilis QB928]|nr:Putative spore and germination protein [Bacillus subtilis QB928]
MSKIIVGISYPISTKGGDIMGFYNSGGYSGNSGYSNGFGSSFALIVVLFILLIIVGAAIFNY